MPSTNENQLVKERLGDYMAAMLSCHVFINRYVQINDPNHPTLGWFPFSLWPEQVVALSDLIAGDNVLVLKARQLGLSWLVLAYVLWRMIFEPGAQILLFSRTDSEAVELLKRVKDMHDRLPDWLVQPVRTNNDHTFEFSNGSRMRAYPTTKHGGRSFTATVAIVDEAFFIRWFKQLFTAVSPTIDNGGQLICISTADKENPNHLFASMWRRANQGLSSFKALFLPWHVHPNRSQAWYDQKVQDTNDLDLMRQEYPATWEEALAGLSSSKRFLPDWLDNCRGDRLPLPDSDVSLALPGLSVYELPQPGVEYVMAVDTSEGLTSSDPTPATVFRVDTWEEVAHMWGIVEMTTLADYITQLARWYNDAVAAVERNNHGHAVIATMQLTGNDDLLYVNPFDKRPGWQTGSRSKINAVTQTASALKSGELTIHTEESLFELGDLERSTLAAPSGHFDDRAMTVIIGVAALVWPSLPRRKRRKASGIGIF